MGTLEYSSCVRAKGHDAGIMEFFSKPQGGLRSLQERQLQYEVETQGKYKQELEDFKAIIKAMEDIFHGRQSVPTNHQTTPLPDEVLDHQTPPPPEEVHNVSHDDVIHDPFSNIV